MIHRRNVREVDDSSCDAALEAFASILGTQKAVYLSGPITTGRRLFEAILKGTADLATIQEANEKMLANAVAELRKKHRYVIDPGSFVVRGWSQEQYHQLWLSVLDRLVDRLIVLDGWEFSVGCAIELARALQLGLPIFDYSERELPIGRALRMLDEAIAELANRGASFPEVLTIERRLHAVADEIREVSDASRH